MHATIFQQEWRPSVLLVGSADRRSMSVRALARYWAAEGVAGATGSCVQDVTVASRGMHTGMDSMESDRDRLPVGWSEATDPTEATDALTSLGQSQQEALGCVGCGSGVDGVDPMGMTKAGPFLLIHADGCPSPQVSGWHRRWQHETAEREREVAWMSGGLTSQLGVDASAADTPPLPPRVCVFVHHIAKSETDDMVLLRVSATAEAAAETVSGMGMTALHLLLIAGGTDRGKRKGDIGDLDSGMDRSLGGEAWIQAILDDRERDACLEGRAKREHSLSVLCVRLGPDPQGGQGEETRRVAKFVSRLRQLCSSQAMAEARGYAKVCAEWEASRSTASPPQSRLVCIRALAGRGVAASAALRARVGCVTGGASPPLHGVASASGPTLSSLSPGALLLLRAGPLADTDAGVAECRQELLNAVKRLYDLCRYELNDLKGKGCSPYTLTVVGATLASVTPRMEEMAAAQDVQSLKGYIGSVATCLRETVSVSVVDTGGAQDAVSSVQPPGDRDTLATPGDEAPMVVDLEGAGGEGEALGAGVSRGSETTDTAVHRALSPTLSASAQYSMLLAHFLQFGASLIRKCTPTPALSLLALSHTLSAAKVVDTAARESVARLRAGGVWTGESGRESVVGHIEGVTLVLRAQTLYGAAYKACLGPGSRTMVAHCLYCLRVWADGEGLLGLGEVTAVVLLCCIAGEKQDILAVLGLAALAPSLSLPFPMTSATPTSSTACLPNHLAHHIETLRVSACQAALEAIAETDVYTDCDSDALVSIIYSVLVRAACSLLARPRDPTGPTSGTTTGGKGESKAGAEAGAGVLAVLRRLDSADVSRDCQVHNTPAVYHFVREPTPGESERGANPPGLETACDSAGLSPYVLGTSGPASVSEALADDRRMCIAASGDRVLLHVSIPLPGVKELDIEERERETVTVEVEFVSTSRDVPPFSVCASVPLSPLLSVRVPLCLEAPSASIDVSVCGVSVCVAGVSMHLLSHRASRGRHSLLRLKPPIHHSALSILSPIPPSSPFRVGERGVLRVDIANGSRVQLECPRVSASAGLVDTHGLTVSAGDPEFYIHHINSVVPLPSRPGPSSRGIVHLHAIPPLSSVSLLVLFRCGTPGPHRLRVCVSGVSGSVEASGTFLCQPGVDVSLSDIHPYLLEGRESLPGYNDSNRELQMRGRPYVNPSPLSALPRPRARLEVGVACHTSVRGVSITPRHGVSLVGKGEAETQEWGDLAAGDGLVCHLDLDILRQERHARSPLALAYSAHKEERGREHQAEASPLASILSSPVTVSCPLPHCLTQDVEVASLSYTPAGSVPSCTQTQRLRALVRGTHRAGVSMDTGTDTNASGEGEQVMHWLTQPVSLSLSVLASPSRPYSSRASASVWAQYDAPPHCQFDLPFAVEVSLSAPMLVDTRVFVVKLGQAPVGTGRCGSARVTVVGPRVFTVSLSPGQSFCVPLSFVAVSLPSGSADTETQTETQTQTPREAERGEAPGTTPPPYPPLALPPIYVYSGTSVAAALGVGRAMPLDVAQMQWRFMGTFLGSPYNTPLTLVGRRPPTTRLAGPIPCGGQV
ncbi:hypothetical protein KIPB_007492 [Kipferlia bialata]|uniref:Uncharacterized protein n=1 Tax=Kipferlia bialata TaxID=797122 RepID=A0A9K3GKM4_9EUKA|nr:hypothetical protein KIPB_007492 [Kipferlia bialata]|eukprot:g7492.t1